MEYAFKSIAIIGRYVSASNMVASNITGSTVSACALSQAQLESQAQTHAQLLELVQHLSAKKIDICIEEKTALHTGLAGYPTIHIDQIGRHAELAIVLGGDGTMLSVARAIVGDNIPLVGINRGRFGFLTDISADNMLANIDTILAGKFSIERRMLLSAEVYRGDENISKMLGQGVALNDVIIKSGLRLIELEVKIDGQFVHKQRSDGLIVSTPTGTTAYALSSGGPILHPKLDAIALVPISPHTLSYRPIAISSTSRIEITLIQADVTHLSLDGQIEIILQQGDKVIVTRAEKTVPLLHLQDYSYYEMLRNKLNWG